MKRSWRSVLHLSTSGLLLTGTGLNFIVVVLNR